MRLVVKMVCMVSLILAISSPAFSQGTAPSPTKEHEYLTKRVGKHTGTMKVWPQGPQTQAMEIPFTEVNTSILNGFWVEIKFDAGPYKGRGMNGYDPIKKKYIGTWTSNMTPHISVMEGTYDEAKHSLTMNFEDYDPMTGKLGKMKSVTSDTPGKPYTMTMLKKDDASGKWVKSFVMTYDKKEEGK